MNNIGVNYKVEGEGETVVFVHGLSDDLNYWEFLATNLKNDYRVIRFDLPGHGQSELGENEMSIDYYSDCLIGILNELNVDNINLIGFSLGSAISLDFALKYPQKVDSLVLMSSFSGVDDHLNDVFAKFKCALNISFEEFYDFILPMVLCPEVIDAHRKELNFLKQIASQTANTQAYIKAIDACADFDVEDKLPKIEIPALVLAGKYDDITLVDSQKSICDNIQNSRLIVFDDVKHNLLVGKNNKKILDILNVF